MTTPPADPRSSAFAVCIALGPLFGVVVGLMLDNIGLWAGIGLLAGVVLGAVFSAKGRGGSKSPNRPQP